MGGEFRGYGEVRGEGSEGSKGWHEGLSLT